MTQKLEVYKCEKCGLFVQALTDGGDLSCCGNPMVLQKEFSVDAAKEKHVPVIEKTATGYKVTVGSVAHPMEEKHWITWIELIADGVSYMKFLNPGDEPVAEFCIKADKVVAREYCNLHGHWKAEL